MKQEKSGVKDRYSQLETDRTNYTSKWQRTCELIFPGMLPIIGYETKPNGSEGGEDIFDTTGSTSLNMFANTLLRNVTPENYNWHQLRGETIKAPESKVPFWKRKKPSPLKIDNVNETLFKFRYAAGSNFTQTSLSCYRAMGAVGNGFMFIDWEEGLNYKFFPIQQVMFDVDYRGNVNTVILKECYTKTEFETFFEKVPAKIAVERDLTKKFWVFQEISPNEKHKEGSRLSKDLKYKSVYVLEDGEEVIETSGYSSMPFIPFQMPASLNEKLGTAVAWNILPDLEAANELSRLGLRSAQYQADAPMGTTDDDVLYDTKIGPGVFVEGAISQDGTALIQPINMVNGGDLVTAEKMERQKNIREAFMIGMSQQFAQGTDQTATEVRQREGEMANQIAPLVSMIQNKSLPKVIERELDLLLFNGIIDPKDVEGLDLTFDSPSNRMLVNDRLRGFYELLERMPLMAQIDPVLPSMIQGKEFITDFIYANNLPNKMLKPYDEAKTEYEKRMKSARANAQAEQQKLQSETRKNNATARNEDSSS